MQVWSDEQKACGDAAAVLRQNSEPDMEAIGSIEIARPIEEVFDYTNHNVAEWSITVVEDEVVSETPDHLGSTFRCVTEDHGCQMEFQGTVTVYDRPTRSVVQLTGKQFDIQAEYTFEDLGASTRVTQRSMVFPKTLFTKLFFGTFGWLFRSSGCKATQKEMESLKQHMEGTAPNTSN